MNIEVFTITYNEEKMLPFFLNHYSKFCNKITIFDNYSDDDTDEIIKSFDKCKLNFIKCNTGGTLNDSVYLNIKNNCWKQSKSDYVIIVDCDEFIYSENINEFFDHHTHDIYQPYGYDMWSLNFPKDDILGEVKTGGRSINYDKVCVFNPSKIKDINYDLGCHQASPVSNIGHRILPFRSEDLKLLHYKNISFDYRINKHRQYYQRLSEFNISTGAGIHYSYDEDQQLSEFNELGYRSTIII